MTATIRPALQELVALAAAMREDWNPDQITGAVLAARTAGWSWERTVVTFAVLMTTDDAEPRDLLEATRDPLTRAAGCGSDPTPEYMAVKNALEEHKP